MNDAIKNQIKQIPPETLHAHGVISLANDNKSYVCPDPACGNGTGDTGDGLTPNLKNGVYLWHCFKCGESFDNIKILAIHYGLDMQRDFVEILHRACDDFGIVDTSNFEKIPNKKEMTSDKISTTEELKLIKADILKAQKNLEKLPADARRGLSIETFKHFNCGYDKKWTPPKSRIENKKSTPTPRLIIPTSDFHYLASAIYRDSIDKKYWKMHAGKKEIFNLNSISVDSQLVIVVEGEIDCMSIWQATGGKIPVIATSGAAVAKNFSNLLKEKFRDLVNKPKFLILFDSDETGRTDAPKFHAELSAAGFPAVYDFLTEENPKKDFNDILREEGESKLAEIVSSLIDSAAEKFEKISVGTEKNEYENFFESAEKTIAADKKAFEEEKAAAIEKIRSLETFDNSVMFQEEILKAAAFCKLFAPADYSRLKNDIQKSNTLNPAKKVDLQDFKGELKDYIAEISKRELDLKHRETVLTATKKTAEFISGDEFLGKVTIPAPFSMNGNGIFKVTLAQEVQICRLPVAIKRKIKNLNSETEKFVLAYYQDKKCFEIPAVSASTIADKRNLPKLADFGLPFTSNNSADMVEFFDAYKFANRDLIPVDYSVKNCGWLVYGGEDFFIDPRWTYQFLNADNSFAGNVIVDSDCYIAQHLKTKGSLEKSKQAFNLAAEKSPLAAFVCYLAVSGFLLRILNERNFVFYIHGKTRGGKSTVLNLATSMLGSERLIFSFDATAKVIPELAANYSDYFLPIDEKQVADPKLSQQFQAVIYSLANGIGRIKLNKDSTIRIPKDWQNITVANGETPLLGDNVTGGANTRLLSVAAPDVILDAETCKKIREIISENYGLVFPRVLNLAVKNFGNDFLRERFKNLANKYEEISAGKTLGEYCRYISVGVVGGFLLHMVLGDEEKVAFEKAFNNGLEILKLAPTLAEISDVEKEKNMIQDFISVNQNHFVGGNVKNEFIQGVWGKIDAPEFDYIARPIVEKACKESGFNYKKVVKDLIDDGFFIGDGKNPTVQMWIGGANGRYFKIPKNI